MKNLVLILPADKQSVGNAVAIALGHDQPPGQTYTVPLSPTGASPATHYGCNTWATDGFVEAIQAGKAQTGLPPADWASVGLTESDVFAMCHDLEISVRNDGEHQGHFSDAIAGLGLQKAEQ